MERRGTSFVSPSLSTALLLLFCHSAVMGQDLFTSLDFTRESLMAFSNGSERVIAVLTPVREQVNKPMQSRPVLPTRPPILAKEEGAESPETAHGKRPAIWPSLHVASVDKSWEWVSKPTVKPPVKPKLTYKRQKKIYKPRASPSNKFLEALNEIERSVATASADTRGPRYSPEKLQKLSALIDKAANHRSFKFARTLLGQALYLLKQRQPGGRSKRNSQITASGFLNDLRRRLGNVRFDTFMAVQGDVTLMFAIDDTGSMSGEIEAAKDIAIDVINHERDAPVDYILSPFNDPEPDTPRVIYRDEKEGALFVQDIKALKAHGGGDCPELTFKGILEALFENPRWGSPMYVFTDASPKDATDANIRDVRDLAEDCGVTINFFTTGQCNSLGGVHPKFRALAEATNGQAFPLSSRMELEQLNGLTGSVLGGSNVISIGSNLSDRKKRSASGTSQYSIPIDDSVQDVTIALTASTNPAGVKLLNPSGVTITSGNVALSQTTVYQISDAEVGAWQLVVPDTAGQHEFRVKSSSPTNVDFEHYFLFTPKRARQTNIPINNPLSGEQAKMVLTVAGVEKVVASSLSLELITLHGERITDVSVASRGSGGAHFLATFTPPSQTFKLKLKGTTRKGNAFERISRNLVEPKAGVLRALRATNEYTLGVGRASPDTVTLQIYNVGRPELFDITAKDRLGYVISLRRKVVRARQRMLSLLSVRLRATRRDDVGKTDILFVTAKGRTSGLVLSHLVHLLVVD